MSLLKYHKMFILQKMDNWLVWSLAGLRIMNNTFAPWQKKSWPLQVPFSRHFLEAEPIGSNPGEQKKEHTVLKYSNVVPVQLSRKPLDGSGRAEHVTAKRHNKWFILCSFKLQQRFRLKKKQWVCTEVWGTWGTGKSVIDRRTLLSGQKYEFYSLKAVEWWTLNSRTGKCAMWNGCKCFGRSFFFEPTTSQRKRWDNSETKRWQNFFFWRDKNIRE